MASRPARKADFSTSMAESEKVAATRTGRGLCPGDARLREARVSVSRAAGGRSARVTKSRASAASATSRVRAMRSSPSPPSSSIPAVSHIVAIPSRPSSMGRGTGSAVVPGTSDTIEASRSRRRFASEDLPAFLRPTRAIDTRSERGVLVIGPSFRTRRKAGGAGARRGRADRLEDRGDLVLVQAAPCGDQVQVGLLA